MSIACENIRFSLFFVDGDVSILGDPGADSGGKGKSKRAEKYGTKKIKERREEPLGTMSYQTSSKRSPPFFLLIGRKNTKVFWHQSEVRFYLKAEQETDRKSIPFLEEHHSWFHFVCKNNANFNELKLKMNTLIHASQSKVTVY